MMVGRYGVESIENGLITFLFSKGKNIDVVESPNPIKYGDILKMKSVAEKLTFISPTYK
nr:hypothetical protein [uncultured Bacillus sp.]